MRATALILTVIAAMLRIAPAYPQDTVNPRQEKSQESAKKIKDLQKQRLAVLKTLTDQLARQYQSARVEVEVLMEARVQLFQAELDAAEKQADRIALYQKFVDELKQQEKIAQGRADAGRGTMSAVLKIQARRLEAELHFEQAKGKKSDAQRLKKSDEGAKIVVANPQVMNVTITQQFVGQIQAHRHIRIRALQTGQIETVPAKEGQTVKKGDLIFTIVPLLYKARLDAELAEVKLAEVEFNNTKKLNEQKVVSAQEVQLYEAKLAKARAKAELAKAELYFTEVRAPFDGLIDRLHEQAGSLIKEGETITTLSDNSTMWVYFNVPEAMYLEYRAGAGKLKEASIDLVLANGRKFKQSGKLSVIESNFDNETGTVSFRADFANPDHVLRHGMTGTALLHRTLTNAILIPQQAAFEIRDKRYVFVVDKEDVAHRREIFVLNQLEGFFVIARDIGVNDRIIVEGSENVRDGEKVKYEVRRPE